MKEQSNRPGWVEEKDPFTLNRHGKSVAKRHHEVAEAAKQKVCNTLSTPCPAPEKKDEIVSILLTNPTPRQVEFLEDKVGDIIDDICIDETGTYVIVENQKNQERVLQFLKENNIKISDDEEVELKQRR